MLSQLMTFFLSTCKYVEIFKNRPISYQLAILISGSHGWELGH